MRLGKLCKSGHWGTSNLTFCDLDLKVINMVYFNVFMLGKLILL